MSKVIFLYVFAVLCFASCKEAHHSNDGKSADKLLNLHSELNLDSTALNRLLKAGPISDSIQEETRQFYRRRNFQLAWFNKGGLTYAASLFYTQLQNYMYNFSDTSLANTSRDTLYLAAQKEGKGFLLKTALLRQLDFGLTVTFFKYAHKAYGGQTKNLTDLEWYIPRQQKNYQITLDSLIALHKGGKERMPLNPFYFRLRAQLVKYRNIEKTGGFPLIQKPKGKLAVTFSDSGLLALKKYLFLTGDLKTDDGSFQCTDSLRNAVKSFQQRMGLGENGELDSTTLLELNKPIAFRIRQIMFNLERLRWAPVEMEQNYLLINIPEYTLHVIQDGKPVWTSRVVVGKTATQTSIFKGTVSQIVLNPYWGVPSSMAINEVLPNIKRNSAYLKENDMEVFSGNTQVDPATIRWEQYKTSIPFTFRQNPGANNALGKIKFLFPNSFDIYLHDTPAKSLFGDTKRAFSHGCIRVADPKYLALLLLKTDPAWNDRKIEEIWKTTKNVVIPVLPTVPIYIVYFTAWVDAEGRLNFRNDLYNLDSKLAEEIFAE